MKFLSALLVCYAMAVATVTASSPRSSSHLRRTSTSSEDETISLVHSGNSDPSKGIQIIDLKHNSNDNSTQGNHRLLSPINGYVSLGNGDITPTNCVGRYGSKVAMEGPKLRS